VLAVIFIATPFVVQHQKGDEIVTELAKKSDKEDSKEEKEKEIEDLIHSFSTPNLIALKATNYAGSSHVILYNNPCPERTTPPPESVA